MFPRVPDAEAGDVATKLSARPETHGRGLEVLGWGVVVLRWEGGDARLTEDQQPDEEGS